MAVGVDGPGNLPLGSVGRGTLLTVLGKPLSAGDVDALTAAGVALLWQLPNGHRARPAPGVSLPDGSYLTRPGGPRLRILGPGVLTNLLDPQRAPRDELLATLPHTAATPGALRPALIGADQEKRPLTSRTFDGIWQEICGRLLVHHALRQSARYAPAAHGRREPLQAPAFAR
jgi:hypothetical protein